jgi:hypothetical protein
VPSLPEGRLEGLPMRSAIDFNRSAYRFYRKHDLDSPLHPMIIPLAAGLLVNFGVRALRAALGRR